MEKRSTTAEKAANAEHIVKSKGHVFVRYETNARVHYICGRCKEMAVSAIANIKHSKGCCTLCRATRSISQKSKQETMELIRQKGHELIYYCSAAKVFYKCGKCGRNSVANKYDMKRQRAGCKYCRRKQ